VVIGGGPIGCEMAQAFCRFGSEVTLIEAASHVLVREDGDAAAIIQQQLERDGVRLVCSASIARVERQGNEKVVHYTLEGRAREATPQVSQVSNVRCDEILVGVGRAPNVEGLGLEAARIAHDQNGVTVNDYLQTTNPRIYAAGDIASRHKFTHTADALARIVLQNALFGGRKRASALHVPWCTYTSPEIAHVGLNEREARARGLEVTTLTTHLDDVDRAILDGETDGFVRIHLKKGTDRILGATIVAAHAGEMISEITVAMIGGVGLGAIATAIHPYPTQAEAIRKTGDAYNRTRLTPLVKGLFARWLAFRRR
jgi:pyruvate/2-oxoglutarate dehydrogenase complex dihydrolipoamide dehydrogenase (E3) component